MSGNIDMEEVERQVFRTGRIINSQVFQSDIDYTQTFKIEHENKKKTLYLNISVPMKNINDLKSELNNFHAQLSSYFC